MGGRGANSQQAHDVVLTSMRRNDVVSTSLRRHVPTGFLINQSQIITFLILKSDIENSRIELKGIVLPVPSNQIIVTFIAIFTLKLGTFVIFGGMPPPPFLSPLPTSMFIPPSTHTRVDLQATGHLIKKNGTPAI